MGPAALHAIGPWRASSQLLQSRYPHMLFNLIDLLMRAEAYVRVWRDSELYVVPVTATSTATSDSTEPEPNVSNISVPASKSRREKAHMRDRLLVVLVAFVWLILF